ncbi:MAG: autotransporter outer membrane beta-barrel domain-containing protein [Betaproteobacteria bacterium]|nr:autotransporter outer membrane beta-barrel domain-containing protein [Betaproteobacteria bacterium]MCL2887018.1 autotransporter outer membrane beta-barrel domain-containing protein [Betaproteobacteria bacterium]
MCKINKAVVGIGRIGTSATATLASSAIAPRNALLAPGADAGSVRRWGHALPFPLTACVAACLCLFSSGALAADVSVAADGNLAASPSPTPGAGTNWLLAGNARINAAITVPAQTSVADALTITAAPSGSTITIGANNIHAFSSVSGSIWINTVGSVTFDGRQFDGTPNPNAGIIRGSFIYNTPSGGANIYLGTTGGNVTVENFNTATGVAVNNANGGAIYSEGGKVEIGNDTGAVTLSNNYTTGVGAAIFILDHPTALGWDITIDGTKITIQDNEALAHSGAMYTGNGDIKIGNTTTTEVLVDGNTAGGSGGAIQAAGGTVTIEGKKIELTGNSTTNWGNGAGAPNQLHGSGGGGAILAAYGATIGNADGSSVINISNNSAWTKGGAIYSSSAARIGDVTIIGKSITLANNTAATTTSLTGLTATSLGGGAIYANGDIKLTGDTIALTGNQAIEGSGGALQAEHSVTITGSMQAVGNLALGTNVGGYGGAIWAGWNVGLEAKGGDIVFDGNQANLDGGAIRAGGNVTLNANTGNIIFQNNIAGSGNGNAIWFQNSYNSLPYGATATFNAAADRSIVFYDSIANNADYGLLTVNKTGAGAVIFDGAGATSQIYGTTTVAGGAFVVRNSAVYGVLEAEALGTPPFAGPSTFTVASGATLAGGISGEVRADAISLLGTLDISGSKGAPVGGASGGYSTFTLTGGTLNFGGDSKILFNTYVNDAKTQLSDKLVLDGPASTGTAKVFVTDTGGGQAAAKTVGDGIWLVETKNGATTTGASFELGSIVMSGPYQYTLRRGSSNENDWYLTSDLRCDLMPNTPVCSPNPITPTVPPYYNPDTSTTTALPPMALFYGMDLLKTLHERVGEEEDIRGRTDLHEDTPKTGGWGRVFGTHGKREGDKLGIYGSDGPKFHYDFVGLQVGHDLHRVEREGKRDHFGVYFAYGQADGDVRHFDGARGDSEFDAYTLGGYWTHFGESGWYIDAVAQATWYDASTHVKGSGSSRRDVDGFGIALSIEGGKPYRFDNGWFIEPQAQLIYQTIDFDSAKNETARVSFYDVDSLVGRLGARIGRTWKRDDGHLMTAWVRPNIWHEFWGDTVTKFASADGPVPFRADIGGTWGEINVGLSGQYDRNTTLFANLSYESRFDGNGHAYGGRIGIRFNW